jgi:hypothetical protein
MEVPVSAYEEAIEKMAKARLQDGWDTGDSCRKNCVNEDACDCLIVEKRRQVAAAEAIGLKEMMESLRNVIDYSRGTGAYNFRRLPEEDRDIARIEVWEKIQERIEAALTHRNPNS